MVKNQNSVLKTSLRSATHATDSTCNGCKAKSAATAALRQTAPVMRLNRLKSRTVLAACSSRLTKCGHHGFNPNNWQSSMCENMVTGCQLRATSLLQAHRKPSAVNPACTCGLAVTQS